MPLPSSVAALGDAGVRIGVEPDAAFGVDTVVVDCESGRFRMRLAADLAHRMGATHVPLENVSASGLVDAVAAARAPHGKAA